MLDINITIQNADKVVKEIRILLEKLGKAITHICTDPYLNEQKELLRKIRLAAQGALIEKGDICAWIEELKTNSTPKDIECVRMKIHDAIYSLNEISELFHLLQADDINIVMEASRHTEKCIIFLKKLKSYSDTELSSINLDVIVQSIFEFSETGSKLILKIDGAYKNY